MSTAQARTPSETQDLTASAAAVAAEAAPTTGVTLVEEPKRSWWRQVLRWFDSSVDQEAEPAKAAHEAQDLKIDWVRSAPWLGMHLACLGVFWVGISPVAVIVAVSLYFIRMFWLTAFYHRYFAHRTFKMNRFWQFIAAVLTNTCTQRGPLWWAAHHRDHHRYSDQLGDVHSAKQYGFFWSHMGWVMSKENARTRMEGIKDFAKFPELRFLDRFHVLVPVIFAYALWLTGDLLATHAPHLGTTGAQMLIWGFFVSTIVLAHGTFTINSLAHLIGRRRFPTNDNSRNSALLAVITLGEGWHNNHHHFPGTARQGFKWWEYDVTYYGLKMLSWMGIVKDLKGLPAHVFKRHEEAKAARKSQAA